MKTNSKFSYTFEILLSELYRIKALIRKVDAIQMEIMANVPALDEYEKRAAELKRAIEVLSEVWGSQPN